MVHLVSIGVQPTRCFKSTLQQPAISSAEDTCLGLFAILKKIEKSLDYQTLF